MRNASLVKARNREGLTQAQVAKLAHISEVAYQRYEQGRRVPNARILFRIADALNITDVDELRQLFGQ